MTYDFGEKKLKTEIFTGIENIHGCSHILGYFKRNIVVKLSIRMKEFSCYDGNRPYTIFTRDILIDIFYYGKRTLSFSFPIIVITCSDNTYVIFTSRIPVWFIVIRYYSKKLSSNTFIWKKFFVTLYLCETQNK